MSSGAAEEYQPESSKSTKRSDLFKVPKQVKSIQEAAPVKKENVIDNVQAAEENSLNKEQRKTELFTTEPASANAKLVDFEKQLLMKASVKARPPINPDSIIQNQAQKQPISMISSTSQLDG